MKRIKTIIITFILGILILSSVAPVSAGCGKWDSQNGVCRRGTSVITGSQCLNGAPETCCTLESECMPFENPPDAGAFSQFVPEFLAHLKLNPNVTTPAGLLNTLLPYILTLAGLVLFGMLIYGGFELLTAANNPEAAEKGKQRLTQAVFGFIIIFVAYWITQILEIVFGINILGN